MQTESGFRARLSRRMITFQLGSTCCWIDSIKFSKSGELPKKSSPSRL